MIIFGKSKKSLKKEIVDLRKDLTNAYNFASSLDNEIKSLNKMIESDNKLIEEQTSVIKKRDKEIAMLKTTNRNIAASKGGLQKENNKLNKLVEELTEKLKEAMSDKFRVKKVPSGRIPKGIPLKLKSSSKQSKIIKNIHKED